MVFTLAKKTPSSIVNGPAAPEGEDDPPRKIT